VLSHINGLIRSDTFNQDKFIFIYKYFFIFTVPLVILNIVNTYERIFIINKVLLFSFVILVGWVFIYNALNTIGVFEGNIRPSFPFTNDFLKSSAHTYSSYLGFFIVGYLSYLRIFFNHSYFISFIITSCAFFSLILTGSRTGILMFAIYSLVYTVTKLYKIFTHLHFSKYKAIFLLLTFIILTISSFIFYDSHEAGRGLIDRSFNFNLFENASSQGRIIKLKIAVDDMINAGFLVGLGVYSSLIWYDGAVSHIISYGGILLFLLILCFISFLMYRAYSLSRQYSTEYSKYLFSVFLLLSALYLVSNIITEYILVSRNAFPVLLLISIVFISMKQNISRVRNCIII